MEASTLRDVAVQVCQYFRDFLESDFKRQQAPRRRIVLQSDSGFRAGMRLRPYPSLEAEIWGLLGKPSGEPLQLRVAPRRHTRSLSAVLRTIIQEHVAAIEEAAIEQVRRSLAEHIGKTYAQSIQDPEKWVDSIIQQLREQADHFVVRPLISKLEGPLQRSAYSLMDSLYAAELDMVGAVVADLQDKLPQVLARHLARRDDGLVQGALTAFLTLDGTRAALSGYFESFVTSDAFLELRDLETYASISEGVQVYLYIGACKFRGVQYPLFFLPVQVDRLPEADGYQLTLVNQLFANRAAIDFVLQEQAAAKMREWASPVRDRINYLAPQQSVFEEARRLFGLVANAMDLAGQINLSAQASDASTADVTLSAALHLCAFDRGEEALINDYEELIELARKGGGAMVDLFERLVGGVLEKNPVSISSAVDRQWDELSLSDRLVFDSPIPLNEEQRKILLAVRHADGHIVVVEGPPGTGKSHTITAIAADCAFNQRSCLVLSDKTEALQVVQNKLSEAMSRVRHDRNFPNPLLRLGHQDANFKRLVANQTINQVEAYAKAMRANARHLEAEKRETAEGLKGAIEKTVSTLGAVPLALVQRLHEDEARLAARLPAALPALQGVRDGGKLLPALEAATAAAAGLTAYLEPLYKEGIRSAAVLERRIRSDRVVAEFAARLGQGSLEAMRAFQQLDEDDVHELSRIVLRYRQLRMPLLGYLLRGAAVHDLEEQLNRLPATRVLQLKPDADQLEQAVTAAVLLRSKLQAGNVAERMPECYRQVVAGRAADPAAVAAAERALEVLRQAAGVPEQLLAGSPDDWVLALQYLRDWLQAGKAFEEAPQFDYVGTKSKLERLNTSMLNAHVDSRLVAFMQNHRADAKTLAQLISQRQKFPEHKFDAVRSSFPIIIASIREFGEYMPLAPELFDVVVIDEASQVSVAQALPAMLRARKVVVLGDSKQFSNVKSSNASIAINDKYRANLVQYFQRNVTQEAEALQRLAMFDVKRSVLEFCSMAASYSIMLRKHFRSYPELISYSSATFYNHQLQAIKVRGVPLEDVVRFDSVEVAGKPVTRTTNVAEAEYISQCLLDLLDDEDPPTVGVITPFREQQTLLTKMLIGHSRGREFEDRLRLKVMTFDSCQGEERNIIFYSMVASPGNDALAYVFPVALDNPAETVEDKLKVQRLNVGFSRAQEMIWFVHSMPLESFRGAIASALHHYAGVLRQKHGSVEQTDAASPMEAKVLGWLQSTQFVQSQPESVEILPQFPIGEYLRQLDPTYQHPSWRVDFLLTCTTDQGPIHIVVEYDGFEFHFQPGAQVHVGNHERYLKSEDVERQLTLESYGYRFLRINRFNLGKDPVATIDDRLVKLVSMATGEQVAHVVERLREQAAGVVNRDMRPCSRCASIKPLEEFFDPALKNGEGGIGRVCMDCKGQDARKAAVASTRRYTPRRWRRRW